MIKVPHAPSAMVTLQALLAAEAHAFLRNARALLWSVVLPLAVMFIAASRVASSSVAAIFSIESSALMLGIFTLGLFGYANVLAGDRERGVFQRLRCSPAPAWQLLGARLLVQMIAVVLQAALVYAAGWLAFGAAPSLSGGLLGIVAAIVAGFAALAVAQAIVALVDTAAAVSAIARVLLLVFILLEGFMFRGNQTVAWLETLGDWTPIRMGTLVLHDALVYQHWGASALQPLLGLLLWIAVLGYLGVTRFRWQPA